MGLFGPSSPFDADVDKATSETNTSENWDCIIDICDKVGTSSKNAKDCLRAIQRRIGHADPHVAIQAITLLDACIKNCGKQFHLEIASREFENEFKRLMGKASTAVASKMRISLKKWAENEFKDDSSLSLIPVLYQKLKAEGKDFTDTSAPPTKIQTVLSTDPNVVSSQQEEDDIAKAIELSLKEKGDGAKATAQSYSALYPAISGGSGGNGGNGNNNSSSYSSHSASKPQPEVRKVRAIYDFEAAEDNELTFFTGEMIYVVDDSDPNWWKGYNSRGEGLFPSNFVTSDLNAEPETNQYDNKSKQMEREEFKPEIVEIDEAKIDRLLHLLNDANPEDPSEDTEEMFILEAQVNQMLPLIDSELERVDRNHAKLTHLGGSLVDALNMYHSLMRDTESIGGYGMMPHQMYRQPSVQPMPNGMYNIPNNSIYGGMNYGTLPHQQQQPQPQQMMPNQFQSPHHMPQAFQPTSLPPSIGQHPQYGAGSITSVPNPVATQHMTGPISLPSQSQSQPQYQQYHTANQQQQQQQQQMIKNEPMHTPNPQLMQQQQQMIKNEPMHTPNPQLMQQQPQSLPYISPPNQPQSFHNSYPNAMQQQPFVAGQPTMLPPNHPNPNMNVSHDINGASYMPSTVMTTQIQPGQSHQQAHLPSNQHPQQAIHQSPIHHHPMIMQNNMAAINQPVTSTILPHSDQRTNIPVFQQQR